MRICKNGFINTCYNIGTIYFEFISLPQQILTFNDAALDTRLLSLVDQIRLVLSQDSHGFLLFLGLFVLVLSFDSSVSINLFMLPCQALVLKDFVINVSDFILFIDLNQLNLFFLLSLFNLLLLSLPLQF